MSRHERLGAEPPITAVGQLCPLTDQHLTYRQQALEPPGTMSNGSRAIMANAPLPHPRARRCEIIVPCLPEMFGLLSFPCFSGDQRRLPRQALPFRPLFPLSGRKGAPNGRGDRYSVTVGPGTGTSVHLRRPRGCGPAASGPPTTRSGCPSRWCGHARATRSYLGFTATALTRWSSCRPSASCARRFPRYRWALY